MRSLILILLFLPLYFIWLPAQSFLFQIDTAPGANPWSNLDLNNDPQEFHFAIITDRTGGHRPGFFEEGIEKLNLLQPEFVMSVGDLIEGYTEDEAVLHAEWDQIEEFISKLQMPFFYVAGNHDLTNATMGRIWKERLGRSYYHFVYKDVLFLCLNSEDQFRGSGKGTISQSQYDYALDVLEKNEQVRHTLVFMHQPLWTLENTERWPDLENRLAQRDHTVFVGHKHGYQKYDRNNGRYFVLATTGGASLLKGPDLGQFDHVVWVTMKNDGPLVANLMLKGIYDENVLTSKKKAFLDQVFDDKTVRVKPHYVRSDNFEKGQVILEVTNHQSIPLKVQLNNGFSWDLMATSDLGAIELGAGQTQKIDIALDHRNNVKLAQMRPVPINLDLVYTAPGLGEVKIPYRYLVKPVEIQTIKRVDQPVVVDGNLDEWKEMSYRMMDIASDNQVRFDAQIDRKYLYLAASVYDDTLYLNNQIPSWQQDGFGWIVRLGSGEDIAGQVSGTSFRINPSFENERQKYYRGDNWPEDLEYIAKADAKGYSVELKLPLKMLSGHSNDWNKLRINCFVDDRDGSSETTRDYWQPNWRSQDNVLGSGMFLRD